MRITFVSWTYGGGGAERVMVQMANYWSAKGWPVHIVTLQATDPIVCYPINHNVSQTFIDLAEVGRKALPKMGLLYQAVALRRVIFKTDPDAVISLMDGPNIYSLLATVGTHIPVFAAEHCDPNTRPLSKRMEYLRKWTYRHAASVVTLTEKAMSYFPARIRSRGHVIPNSVLAPPPVEQNIRREKLIVSIGRLNPVKGFDRLVSAFGKVAAKHQDWSLEIWGEGPERQMLESLVSNIGLGERIRLPGYTSRPDIVLRRASLFALSSSTEGFPMGLCEAMACGVPVVSFDCPSGPREIIRDGIDGLLVRGGDVGALSTAMDRLMSNLIEREQLAGHAPEILERYGQVRIMGRWESILEKTVKERVR